MDKRIFYIVVILRQNFFQFYSLSYFTLTIPLVKWRAIERKSYPSLSAYSSFLINPYTVPPETIFSLVFYSVWRQTMPEELREAMGSICLHLFISFLIVPPAAATFSFLLCLMQDVVKRRASLGNETLISPPAEYFPMPYKYCQI